jgi:hypothetical protein
MIVIDPRQMAQAQAVLANVKNGARRAASNAINRASEAARTEAVRKATERYYIRAKDVRSTITLTKAKPERLIGYVKSRDTGRPLSFFKVNPNAPRKSRPNVLRVATIKETGIKDLPKAFIARGKTSGKIHVLKRIGKDRYPVHVLYGPAVPQMLDQDKVKWMIVRRASEMMESRLDHEISRLLRGRQ